MYQRTVKMFGRCTVMKFFNQLLPATFGKGAEGVMKDRGAAIVCFKALTGASRPGRTSWPARATPTCAPSPTRC